MVGDQLHDRGPTETVAQVCFGGMEPRLSAGQLPGRPHVAAGHGEEPHFGRLPEVGAAAAAREADLLTAEEVASLLRMTPGWVYAQTREQRIPHLRLGRYVRFRRDALEGWMEEIECDPRERPSGAR